MRRASRKTGGGQAEDPLFLTRTGRRLSRDAIERRVNAHTTVAAQQRPSLHGKRVSPHDELATWASLGATHGSVDTMGWGFCSFDEHLSALEATASALSLARRPAAS